MSEEELPYGDFNYIMGQSTETVRDVEIPEWNCKVKIKALSKAEQVRLRKTSTVRGNLDETKLEMNLLVYSMVEPQLTFDQVDKLFSDSDPAAVNRIVASALTLSGLTEDYVGSAEADLKS